MLLRVMLSMFSTAALPPSPSRAIPRASLWVRFDLTSNVVDRSSPLPLPYLDGCVHTSVTIDEVPASIDIVNCVQLKLKCKGNVNSVNVTKTNGAKVSSKLLISDDRD